ncbi:metallophosphoesterase family protein [Planctobacterium marinum]|uniref:metallophosphoesterase family protein n=1 Tax=Planctobacterium marinum TaxID=1631968 RepID=UPI001E4504D1|nr:metallophosphoesterase family protein [Planctobacterium marinum]MCC2606119.1 metallophosphatase family protein [Planctobacterium marinum]
MIALISDVHGNLPALEAVLEDIQRYPVKEIISLGDVVGYYPMINECIELLRAQNVSNVMGNHDYYLIHNESCKRSKTVDQLISFQSELIKNENLSWLSQSPLKIERENSSFVHGGWKRGFEEYLYRVDHAYFEKFDYRYFFAGHTHVQCLYQFENGQTFCNPGSVGQPRDGNPCSAWALFDNEKITLRRVPYDITPVKKSMAALGFDDKLTKHLHIGGRINGSIDKITVT